MIVFLSLDSFIVAIDPYSDPQILIPIPALFQASYESATNFQR
jgi:hypothetical protein